MILNNGANGNVINLSRITDLGLEPPPDFDIVPVPRAVSALGGRTAPSGVGGYGGGGIPPQSGNGGNLDDLVVVCKSAAPPDRQDYTNDGGGLTSTPPPSVRRMELQKGVADVVGQVGDWDSVNENVLKSK